MLRINEDSSFKGWWYITQVKEMLVEEKNI
jgi:hypothetical protein